MLALGAAILLMPHEPDLGFGRPAAQAVNVEIAVQTCRSLGIADEQCRAAAAQAVTSRSGEFSDLRTLVLDKLRSVKADIESDRERTAAAEIVVGEGRGAAVSGAARPPEPSEAQ
ncbi:MAG: hypothetical protein WDN08_00475 [Rhizomicrobium sp.]